MKELDKTYTREFKQLEIYADDIRKIYKLFTEKWNDVSFIVDNNQIESIDDFKELTGKAREIEIEATGRSPSDIIKLSLTNCQARYSVSTNTKLEYIGFGEKIASVLASRQSRDVIEYENVIMILVCALSFLIVILLIDLRYKFSGYSFDMHSPYLFASLLLFALFMVFIGLSPRKRFRHCIINLVDKKDKPSFFFRKKDDIIIAIVSLFVGGYLFNFSPIKNLLSPTEKAPTSQPTSQMSAKP